METKRRALGKGLEELFYNEPIDYQQLEEKIVQSTPKEEVVNLPIRELRPNPYQPRKNFDEEKLKELATSIQEHGVFQPIIAKKSIKGYEIVAGERRVKASQLAGLDVIPAIVKDFSDEAMMEIALLENLQRENLNPLEEAIAYKKLQETLSPLEEASAYKKLQETLSLTQDMLAHRLGKSRSYVTNMLGLLTLPEEVKDFITTNQISMGHARVLSKLVDKEQIKYLAEKIVAEGLSVRALEELATQEKYPRRREMKRKVSIDEEYTYIENFLEEKLGTKVKVKNNKLVISFTNKNDLNRILEVMQINK